MGLLPGEQRAGAGHFVHLPRSRTPAAPARYPQQLSRNHVSARVHHPAARSLVSPALWPCPLLEAAIFSDQAVCWTHVSLHGGQAALGLWGKHPSQLSRSGAAPLPPTPSRGADQVGSSHLFRARQLPVLLQKKAERWLHGASNTTAEVSAWLKRRLPGCLAALASQRLVGSRLEECGIIHSACQYLSSQGSIYPQFHSPPLMRRPEIQLEEMARLWECCSVLV